MKIKNKKVGTWLTPFLVPSYIYRVDSTNKKGNELHYWAVSYPLVKRVKYFRDSDAPGRQAIQDSLDLAIEYLHRVYKGRGWFTSECKPEMYWKLPPDCVLKVATAYIYVPTETNVKVLHQYIGNEESTTDAKINKAYKLLIKQRKEAIKAMTQRDKNMLLELLTNKN